MSAHTDPATATVTVPCAFCGTFNRVDLTRVDDRPRCGSCQRPILLDRPVTVSDDSFTTVVGEATVPVVVDFYADWCGPCKMMAPLLDQLAHERRGDLVVAKLDTDRNQRTAMQFGIRGIPTLIVFRNGREAAREVGLVPRERLDALLR